MNDIKCQCGECTVVDTFECEGCHKIRPYCYGCDDEYFDLCDFCWADVQQLQSIFNRQA